MAHGISLVGALAPRLPHKETSTPNTKLLAVAKKLESQFISEMLKSAGYGKPRSAFGGGPGEEGFASFLVQAQADKIVEAGGFGLAQKIYQSLKNSD